MSHLKNNRWIWMILLVWFNASLILHGAELWETLPRQDKAVHDFAGIIDSGTETRLEQFLRSAYQSLDTPIVVVTLKSIEGGQIDDFTNHLYEKWGIGTKPNNRGVLFLISVEERKMRIETGYGTEPIITDTLSANLIAQVARPRFKTGNYSEGIDQVCRIIAGTLAKAEGKTISGSVAYQASKRHDTGGGIIQFIFVIIVLISVFGGRNSRRGGLSRWIIPMLLTSGGFHGGSRGGFGSSGSSGGGFGGFGGGFSGGGGASGGW